MYHQAISDRVLGIHTDLLGTYGHLSFVKNVPAFKKGGVTAASSWQAPIVRCMHIYLACSSVPLTACL